MNRTPHRFFGGVEEKYCSGCSEWRDLASFCKLTESWDGLGHRCRSCRPLNKPHVLVCEICNEPFLAKRLDAKTCSDKCRGRKRHLENYPNAGLWENSEVVAVGEDRPCIRCGRSFTVTPDRRLFCSVVCYRQRASVPELDSMPPVETEAERLERNRERNRMWRASNREYGANKARLDKYRLSPEQYQTMVASQNGICAACGESPTGTLHVDHDHGCCPGTKSCGNCLRGLVCRRCNRVMGMCEDAPSIIRSLVHYINLGIPVWPWIDDDVIVWRPPSWKQATDYKRYNDHRVSPKRFVRILALQNFRCKCCGSAAWNTKLHVDHDHTCCPSNRRGCGLCVRGILCARCNKALGISTEDNGALTSMASYLESFTKGEVHDAA